MLSSAKEYIKKIQAKFVVIAALTAFLTWFLCLNLADPVTYQNFSLQLKVLNEDALTGNLKLLENKRELEGVTVNVHVTGVKSDLDKLVPDATIYAYVDLESSELVNISNSKIGTPIPVRVSIGFSGVADSGSYSITMLSPEMANIVLDRVQTKSMIILLNRTGVLPAGYVAMSPVRDVLNATITGPYSIVSRIERLSVDVDLTDARSDIEDELPIKAYNDLDEEITGITLDVETLRFRIPIYKTSVLNIYTSDPAYDGTPASDVEIVGFTWEPRSVEVMVHVDEADMINSLTLDPANVTGMTETATFSYDVNTYFDRIKEEQGITLMLTDPEKNEVRVTVVAEPVITREFEISVDRGIHFAGETSLGDRRRQVLSETVVIMLKGIESVINKLKPEEITGLVDVASVADKPDGTYDLQVTVNAPQNTEAVGQPPVITVRLSTYSDESDAVPNP